MYQEDSIQPASLSAEAVESQRLTNCTTASPMFQVNRLQVECVEKELEMVSRFRWVTDFVRVLDVQVIR